MQITRCDISFVLMYIDTADQADDDSITDS